MFSAFERMIAFRYLRARRKEGFISVIAGFSLLGIALGVATLIVVMAVMNGFRQELMGRILGINAHISIGAYQKGIEDFDTMANTIRTVDGIITVAPLVDGQVMASGNNYSSGAQVKGMRYEDVKAKTIISDNIDTGTLESLQEPNHVIVGAYLAANLGVRVGDKITLISPQGRATVVGMIPRTKEYIVGGTFQAGMYEYDSTTIFMPFKDAQLFFRYPNQARALEIMTSDGDKTPYIINDIMQKIPSDYLITDWKQSNSQIFNALDVERSVMFLILTLIILVAAFNIISSLIMLVNDKGASIAILRTIGATRGMILRIFFLCGSSIGVVGTLSGVALGVSFASNIRSIQAWVESLTGSKVFDPVVYFLSELPAEINPTEVTAITIMALTLSFLATIYPSWKAAKQNPADALRYE